MVKSKEVDEYIKSFREPTKARLEQLRAMAHECIPGAHERISYGVPTLCDDRGKYIAYFAGYKDFVSIYPVHLADKVKGIESHLSGKSTARFANKEPLPEAMISQLFTNLLLAYKGRSS